MHVAKQECGGEESLKRPKKRRMKGSSSPEGETASGKTIIASLSRDWDGSVVCISCFTFPRQETDASVWLGESTSSTHTQDFHVSFPLVWRKLRCNTTRYCRRPCFVSFAAINMPLTEAWGRVLRCGEGVVAPWVCYGVLAQVAQCLWKVVETMECYRGSRLLW